MGVKKEDAVEKKVVGGNKFWEPWIAKGKVVTHSHTPIISLKWIESIFQDVWEIWEGIIFNQDVYNNYLDDLHTPFLPF